MKRSCGLLQQKVHESSSERDDVFRKSKNLTDANRLNGRTDPQIHVDKQIQR
jgi:hypothetical protein